ncbi:SUKH-4 family immunity protein [Micromonospora aurantiaca (nom. illeg.)]|uniref:SUKH-4 family immunity protein n=1 Tax=Micromonospora aurantiaca (nom. illeg.) TaxID=47850 RepID=UPI00119FC09D|nr:SUKH-4 family immunity protein [Micromonospora aurantiaca]MBC9004979.1 SUKH-4 family immunity protein [Micromonospora aurantiaca]
MHAAELLPWPRFALRSMACPEGTPESVRQVVGMYGIPVRGVGGEYIALPEATFLDSAKNFLAFGESGLTGRICVDVNSLKVVHVPVPGDARVNPVNSNLIAFSACVKAVIASFPYYTYETAEESGEEVAANLRNELLTIDRAVGAHDGLWETFLDDVAMGNYAEEEFEHASLGDGRERLARDG